MKLRDTSTLVALVLVAGFVALTLLVGAGAAPVWASSENNGQLHVTKECSEATGAPGAFCTFTASNLAQLPVHTQVIYTQAPILGGSADLSNYLDSNVVLFVGTGDWAVGRCTLDFATGLGLCTFSDGTGELTGFEARVDVSYCPSCLPLGSGFSWDGTYRFRSQPPR